MTERYGIFEYHGEPILEPGDRDQEDYAILDALQRELGGRAWSWAQDCSFEYNTLDEIRTYIQGSDILADGGIPDVYPGTEDDLRAIRKANDDLKGGPE